MILSNGGRGTAMSDENVPLDFAENLEATLQHRLGCRVRNLRVRVGADGLVLEGQACTYHAKQLAQHWAMEESDLPVLANEIEVR